MKPTLYPNGFPSAYEELKTFYPVFYRDVFEMDAIWRTCGGGLDEIEDDVDRVANSTYISLMDEKALVQMETFLGIPPDSGRTLEERRKLLKRSQRANAKSRFRMARSTSTSRRIFLTPRRRMTSFLS